MAYDINHYADLAVKRKKISREQAIEELTALKEKSTSDFNFDLLIRSYLDDPTHPDQKSGKMGTKHGSDVIEAHHHTKE